MTLRTSRALCAFVFLCALLSSRAVSAQTSGGAYIAAGVFADMRQFGSTQTVPFYQDDFSLDKTGAGGGLRIGTFLHPRWSLELSAEVGTRTTSEFENPIRILIFPPPPPFELKASTSFVTVSTLIGFHPPAVGRVRLGYRAGFSFVRGTYKSDYPAYPYPLADELVALGFPRSGFSFASFSTSIFPLPRVSTFTQRHNTGALTLGFDAAVDLTSRLALVPEIRALVFSAPSNGPGVFLIRPGVGVRWNF